jgi:DNA ligase-1
MTQFPILYHKGKNGEMRQWRCWADNGVLYTEHGMVGGALQTSSVQCVPKNTGKKNATTSEEQAIEEAKSLHKFKLDRKYSLTKEEAKEQSLLPMLAHKFDQKKHRGSYFMQPKLDGVRCIARWEGDKVVLYSRSGKVYDVKHISDELATFMGKDDVFDGELYIHGMPLQSQISLIKKPKPESVQIKYWVYDIPVVNGVDDLDYQDRWTESDRIFGDYYDRFFEGMTADEIIDFHPAKHDSVCIVEVDTYLINDLSEIKTDLANFVEDGFEGAILRHPESKYLWGYRSDGLLKVKEFQDAEFKVVDVIEGVGKMVGCAIFICQNDINGSTFKAVPKMTMEQRADIYRNKDKFIGYDVTVKFFDRTEDGVPRFPVAIAVRDYE